MSKTLVKSPAADKHAGARKSAPATSIAHAPKPLARAGGSKSSASVKAAVKAPVKSAGKAPARTASSKVPVKTAPRSAAKTVAKTTPKAAPRSTSRPPAAAVLASAPVNRFAERFSPVRPPARGYPEPMEFHKTAIKADPRLVNAWKSKSGSELSEPELLAMPEAEYMNETQRDFFRARLQGLKDDLLSNAGKTTEHLREDTSIVPDPADRATIEEEHSLELRTRDRERKLLKKIMQSLGRIESGDYGFCDETGEPIGLRRLLARPTATLSLEAQQRRELKQKMFGD